MAPSQTTSWSRAERILLALIIAALIACALGGCGWFGRDAGANPPTGQGKMVDPVAPETAAAKVARLEGELATAKVEHEQERLAPLRTSLAWVEGIALIGMLACVGLAVAAMFWGLGFGWKIPAGIGVGCGGILAMSLATSWALGHIGWIIAGVVALIAIAIAWALNRHLTLIGAAREAWAYVPPEAATSARVDALLDQLTAHLPKPRA